MDSLGRMVSIFDLLTAGKSGVTADEVSEALSCSRTTSYRYLKALTDAGLLAGHSNGQYGLGSRIVQLDRHMRIHDPLLTRADELLPALCHRIGENLLLNTYYGDSVVCIGQYWETQIPLATYGRGQIVPLFAGAASKAIVAHFPPHRLKALMAKYPEKISAAGLGSSLQEFRDKLREVRQKGYVVSFGEVEKDVAGVAVPVFDDDGSIVGSLVAVIPMDRYPSDISFVRDQLISTSKALTPAKTGADGSTPHSDTSLGTTA